MSYVIEVRRLAEYGYGLVMQKGKVKQFPSEEQARTFGKENIEKSRYIASWEAITVTQAKQKGHEVN